MVGKKIWRWIIRVPHFSHILEPSKEPKKSGGLGVSQIFFFFFQQHFRVSFGRTANVHNLSCHISPYREKSIGIKGRALLGVSQGRFNLQCLQETQVMFARPLTLFA